MIKRTHILRCDDSQFQDKNNLSLHKAKYHASCQKIFPTITALNMLITAVHDNTSGKHQIEKKRLQFKNLKNQDIQQWKKG